MLTSLAYARGKEGFKKKRAEKLIAWADETTVRNDILQLALLGDVVLDWRKGELVIKSADRLPAGVRERLLNDLAKIETAGEAVDYTDPIIDTLDGQDVLEEVMAASDPLYCVSGGDMTRSNGDGHDGTDTVEEKIGEA